MSVPEIPPSALRAPETNPGATEGSVGQLQARPGILVVDDDGQIRRLLNEVLVQNGFQVFLANSAGQAVEQFRLHRQSIVLALIDLFMPNQNGVLTLKALRAMDASLCCCFVTGGCGDYSVDDLFAQGATMVFHKPFSLNNITRALRHLIFGPRFQAVGPEKQPSSPETYDRRRFPRWQGSPQDVLVAPLEGTSLKMLGTIVNRSLGGICLVFDEVREKGTVMRVRSTATPLEKWLSVEVQHARRDGDRWALGCRFVDPPTLGVFSIYG
jgi:CheY-like chemotaxis protein